MLPLVLELPTRLLAVTNEHAILMLPLLLELPTRPLAVPDVPETEHRPMRILLRSMCA